MIGTEHPAVAVDGFSGPLDLLLRLVERRELDILAISLAEVADQYLAHLSLARQRDPEHLSAFLTVAAKLLLIKSNLLLPIPPKPAAEEIALDPSDLAQRLRIYQQFRRAAEMLVARDEANLRSYPRPPTAYQGAVTPAPPLDPEILRAAYVAVSQRPRPSRPESLVTEARVSVAEVMTALRAALRLGPPCSLQELVAPAPSPQRYVATFLAILEVVRLGLAEATQTEPYGDIIIAQRQGTTDAPGHHPEMD